MVYFVSFFRSSWSGVLVTRHGECSAWCKSRGLLTHRRTRLDTFDKLHWGQYGSNLTHRRHAEIIWSHTVTALNALNCINSIFQELYVNPLTHNPLNLSPGRQVMHFKRLHVPKFNLICVYTIFVANNSFATEQNESRICKNEVILWLLSPNKILNVSFH